MSFSASTRPATSSARSRATGGDAYSMKLHSPDDDIQGCELSGLAPVSSSLGNVITMSGMRSNIAGCAGDAVGAAARIMRSPPARR